MNGSITDMLNLYITTDEGEILLKDKLVSFWIPKKPYTKNPKGSFIKFNAKCCETPIRQKEDYDIVEIVDYELKEWDLYESKFLERSSGPHIQSANVTTTVLLGYVNYTPAFGYYHNISHLEYGLSDRNMPCTWFTFNGIFGPFSQNKYVICLSNIMDLVCVFDTNGIRKELNHFPDTGLVSLIGNRQNGSGLDTAYLYFDRHDDIAESSNGVCINARKARFKGVAYHSFKTQNDVKKIDEKNGEFSLICAKPTGMYNDDCTIGSYLSKYISLYGSKEILNTDDDFFVCQDSERNVNSNIPFKHFHVELLCSLKYGVYYVQNRRENESIIVGKLFVTEKKVESKVLCTITKDEIPVEPSKLNPLTMVNSRNADVVVVCSVADNSETFVMIRLSKDEQCTTELLELHESGLKVTGGSVIDLEMDTDGNTMYAIEDKDGQQYCGFTKYIM